MRKRFLFFSTLILGAWGMVSPASAEVRVEHILVNQAAPLPEATNVRVNLINTGFVTERPSAVELHIRGQADSAWRTVKTWTADQLPMKIAAGERLTLMWALANRDEAVFGDPTERLPMKKAGGDPLALASPPAVGEVMDPALTTNGYELRAIVFGANGQLSSLEVQP